MRRAVRLIYWVLPIVFCVWLYWLGMRIWFTKDDFAWLGLRIHVQDFRSFLWAMFNPFAQGTIRPWSERGFFMLFSYFFGMRALPYRLFVFLNQFVNVVLVMLVTRQITRSDVAAFAAPLLWLASPALLVPMSWTASYNEIQCTTFLLLSFYFFVRYTESGESRFYWAQFVTFVLGFGSLEIIVVYPAIAAVYAFLFARRTVLSTIPMFGASAIYAIIHRIAAGRISGRFYYDMDFHLRSLLSTLIHYWAVALGVPAYTRFLRPPGRISWAVLWTLTAVVLSFAAWQARNRRYLPVFCLCWFLIVLAPLLPLRNHLTDYYLTMPAIGLAILGAYGMSVAWRKGWVPGVTAAALLLVFLIPASRLARANMLIAFSGTDRVRALVQSVAYAKRIHPGKTILLKNVDDDLFWSSVYDSPFRIFGWNDVFVTPDGRQLVHEDVNLGDIEPYFLSEGATSRVLRDGGAVVYEVEDRKLRNVTQPYTALVESMPPAALSKRIDVGVPYYNDQVGDGWYSVESGYRWSTGHAVIYLPGPATGGQKLYLHGRALDVEIQPGPLHLDVTVDGHREPRQTIDRSNQEFEFSYDLPTSLVGRPKIEVALTLDRTTQIPGTTASSVWHLESSRYDDDAAFGSGPRHGCTGAALGPFAGVRGSLSNLLFRDPVRLQGLLLR